MNLKNNPELIPLIDWWEKDGKSTVTWLVVAAALVGGWYGFKHHRAAVKAAASDALVSAYTTEELEEAVSKYTGDAQGALKIRLAKNYYDAGRFEEAMGIYDELIAKPVEGFDGIPQVGHAQCLEALKKFAEAAKEFDAFVAANPKSYLELTAKLGSARCVAQGGDKAAALKTLETLAESVKDDEIAKARVEATVGAIKRLELKK